MRLPSFVLPIAPCAVVLQAGDGKAEVKGESKGDTKGDSKSGAGAGGSQASEGKAQTLKIAMCQVSEGPFEWLCALLPCLADHRIALHCTLTLPLRLACCRCAGRSRRPSGWTNT